MRFVAGRGAAAKSYREDAAGWGAEAALMAGRGAVAELLAGRGAVAELLAESAMAKRIAALWQRAIGKMLLAGAPWRSSWQGRCGRDTAARESHREEDVSGGRCGRATSRQPQKGITTQKKRE